MTAIQTVTTSPFPIGGRPLKLTEVSPDLLLHLKDGLTLGEAAEMVGISYRCLRRWVKIGEDELSRVEDNPKASVKKDKKIYVDFALHYRQARAERRKTLHQTSTLVALGGYRLKEKQTTQVYKNGSIISQIEIEKTKDIGPDGMLALRLLQYQDLQDNKEVEDPKEKEDDNPLLPIFNHIAQMSRENLAILAENLEAAQ